MRFHFSVVVAGILLLGALNVAVAQGPASNPGSSLPPSGAPAGSPAVAPARLAPDIQLAGYARDAAELQQQQAAAADQGTKKQLEILQKQIETQQKMIQLLMEQVKKQGQAGAPTGKLEEQTATLESRERQSAQREDEIAQTVSDLAEHIDSTERYGPTLPAPLKELFLPSGNNETPLSIYGALAFGYQRIIGDAANAPAGPRPPTPGGFYFGEFTPDFFLKLNDQFFLEAEIAVGGAGSASVGSFAQADWFVNDWLTITAGRFVVPIGFYNERLNYSWINKLPVDAPGSAPLLWLQVLPPLSALGAEATGAFYLGCSPIKMEYAAYISNGLNITRASSPTINQLANLENMTDTFNVISNEKAIGGRLGLWWPEMGLEGGVSAMFNGDYIGSGGEDSISLYAIDLNYHKGDWDARFEYGETFQQAADFLGTNIRRKGFYGQVAYRPRECTNRYLASTELVYRYSYVDFRGIDPAALRLTTFSTPIDVPVRRQQNEFGINYYFYPRMVLKVAYQINDEPGFHLHDNQFITEFAWGW